MFRIRTILIATAVMGLTGTPGDQVEAQAAGSWRLAGPGFIALSVTDLEASTEWYGQALGMELVREVEARDGSVRIRILRRGDLIVELIAPGDPIPPDAAFEGAPAYRFLGIFKSGFFVEGIDELHVWLRSRGVETDEGIGSDDALGLRTFIFRDPDGNRLQAFARPSAGARIRNYGEVPMETVRSGANTISYTSGGASGGASEGGRDGARGGGRDGARGGEAETLVWIHGGGVDHRMWTPQLEHFGPTHRVIAYDIRGHGRSDAADNSLPDTDDLMAILDGVGETRVTLIGLSLGTIIALDFALAHPDRVERLVLVSPGLLDVMAGDPSYLEPIAAIGSALEDDDLDAALEVIDRITFEGRRKARVGGLEGTRAYVHGVVRRHVANGNHTRVPVLGEPAPGTRLGEMAIPTLILYGLEDLPYVERSATALAEGLPNATLVSIPGAGHMLNVEREDEVNRAIERFLARPGC